MQILGEILDQTYLARKRNSKFATASPDTCWKPVLAAARISWRQGFASRSIKADLCKHIKKEHAE